MRYKDKDMNLKEVAVELGVSNILEGSIQRDGNKIRVVGQLIEAETDKHYDYIVNNKRDQVKRYEVASTNLKRLGVNLTQTHGDRSAQDAFYKVNSFDRLVICDLGLNSFVIKDFEELPRHNKYPNHLKGRFTIFHKDFPGIRFGLIEWIFLFIYNIFCAKHHRKI